MLNNPQHSARALVVATMAARALGMDCDTESVQGTLPLEVIEAHRSADRALMSLCERPEEVLIDLLTNLDITPEEFSEEQFEGATHAARAGAAGSLYWALGDHYGAARSFLLAFLAHEDLTQHYVRYASSERGVRAAIGLPALAL